MTARPEPRTVHVRAPGKINVFLEVGALQDDGYHDVAIAYQAVSLYEDVRRLREADFFTVGSPAVSNSARVPLDDSNIAIKAASCSPTTGYHGRGAHRDRQARAGHRRHGRRIGGCRRHPARLRRTLGYRPPARRMLGLARQLGADVPFAFTGGTAIGTGRGDDSDPPLRRAVPVGARDRRLRPVDARRLPRARRASCAARRRGRPGRPRSERRHRRSAGAPRGRPAHARRGHAQRPASPGTHLEPSLAKVIETGERNGALAGIVSGSGPTVAFLAADLDSALELQIALSAAQLTVVRATGPVHGARIVPD